MFQKKMILGFPINIINLEETIKLLETILQSRPLEKPGERVRVITINPEMMMMGLKDSCLVKSLQSGDLIVPDGIGVVLAMRLFGVKGQQRAGHGVKEVVKRPLMAYKAL